MGENVVIRKAERKDVPLLLEFIRGIARFGKMENEVIASPEVLEQMELLEPTPEGYNIKNVAAMMFAERPDRFFKQSQIDIVVFPEGREKNPNNMIEVEPIRGSVPTMIEKTLSYLSTNVIKKQILKPKDREESDKFYNYPYQALEETVVNSLYHRDWTIREPVEITIEPDRISILNFSGPNHTIPMEAIREGKSLRSRRYRNRRLGEFLKELDLTEGRSTGVPTIQEKLADNGSPRATFETTEDRLTFLIHIPIHAGCGNKPATEKTTVITTEKSAIGSEKNGSGSEKSSEKNQAIISAIRLNPKVTAAEIAMKLGVSSRAVEKRIKTLRENGVIRRIGGDKGGYWEVIENGTEQ